MFLGFVCLKAADDYESQSHFAKLMNITDTCRSSFRWQELWEEKEHSVQGTEQIVTPAESRQTGYSRTQITCVDVGCSCSSG